MYAPTVAERYDKGNIETRSIGKEIWRPSSVFFFFYTQDTFSYSAYVQQRSLTTRSLCLSLGPHSSTTLAQFTRALSFPLRLSLFRAAWPILPLVSNQTSGHGPQFKGCTSHTTHMLEFSIVIFSCWFLLPQTDHNLFGHTILLAVIHHPAHFTSTSLHHYLYLAHPLPKSFFFLAPPECNRLEPFPRPSLVLALSHPVPREAPDEW